MIRVELEVDELQAVLQAVGRAVSELYWLDPVEQVIAEETPSYRAERALDAALLAYEEEEQRAQQAKRLATDTEHEYR